jgi:coenzyme F420-reducing hydrogenase delta subunit
MLERSDGKAYESEAVVDPSLCLSCGLCVGSCPTATPFRRHSALSPGIDMPDLTASVLRERLLEVAERLQGDRRVIVFSCQEGPGTKKAGSKLNDNETATVDIICAAQLPPSFIDFILSRNLADAVAVAGCAGGNCQYRFGAEWTEQRIARERDPRLRKRVDTDRVALAWIEPWSSHGKLPAMVAALRESLPQADAVETAPERRTGPAKAWKIPVTAVAYALFAVVVGWLSVWPRFELIDQGRAMVSVSFSHAGQRIGECRKLSQEELNKLPPNMRKLDDCPRERLPVRVQLSSDGQPLYEAVMQPSGLWSDGESSVYRRLTLAAGKQRLFIAMRDSDRSEGFDYSLEQEVDLAPGQHLVVNFDSTQQKFVFRQE